MSDKIEITCPKCKHKFKVDLNLLSPGKSVKCPKCGGDIKFTGDDIAKSVSSFKKSLAKNFSKKITIKL